MSMALLHSFCSVAYNSCNKIMVVSRGYEVRPKYFPRDQNASSIANFGTKITSVLKKCYKPPSLGNKCDNNTKYKCFSPMSNLLTICIIVHCAKLWNMYNCMICTM